MVSSPVANVLPLEPFDLGLDNPHIALSPTVFQTPIGWASKSCLQSSTAFLIQSPRVFHTPPTPSTAMLATAVAPLPTPTSVLVTLLLLWQKRYDRGSL